MHHKEDNILNSKQFYNKHTWWAWQYGHSYSKVKLKEPFIQHHYEPPKLILWQVGMHVCVYMCSVDTALSFLMLENPWWQLRRYSGHLFKHEETLWGEFLRSFIQKRSRLSYPLEARLPSTHGAQPAQSGAAETPTQTEVAWDNHSLKFTIETHPISG